jgi:putative ABC transport system permease protein
MQFRTNPLRTLLTLLGIVFGVGSVVAMVSVGEGAQQEIIRTIEAMGATTTHVKAKPVESANLEEVVLDSAGLSRADVRAIRAVLPWIKSAAWRARHPLKVTDLPIAPHDVNVLAVSADLFKVHNLKVALGRSLLPSDHAGALRTAVIGGRLARELFPDGAIGQQIRLDYAFFEVVGVLSEQSSVGEEMPFDPQIYDRAVMVPFETALLELKPADAYGELDMVSLEVESTEETLRLKRSLFPLLRKLHGGVTDFEIISPEEILQQRKAAQSLLNLVLISIAAISLIVGGIGIMNIMLANIMERISEIGLRRAVGARRRDIRNQFLLEAVLICVVGGVLGLILGMVVGFAVAWMVEIPFAFAWESMVLSFGISLLIGAVFGLVPAMRAANIDPIDALRGQ